MGRLQGAAEADKGVADGTEKTEIAAALVEAGVFLPEFEDRGVVDDDAAGRRAALEEVENEAELGLILDAGQVLVEIAIQQPLDAAGGGGDGVLALRLLQHGGNDGLDLGIGNGGDEELKERRQQGHAAEFDVEDAVPVRHDDAVFATLEARPAPAAGGQGGVDMAHESSRAGGFAAEEEVLVTPPALAAGVGRDDQVAKLQHRAGVGPADDQAGQVAAYPRPIARLALQRRGLDDAAKGGIQFAAFAGLQYLGRSLLRVHNRVLSFSISRRYWRW